MSLPFSVDRDSSIDRVEDRGSISDRGTIIETSAGGCCLGSKAAGRENDRTVPSSRVIDV
jgi:hypothetical protein